MAMATRGQTVETDRRPLTVDEVVRMSEAGIIGETERVELVDGALIRMSPEGPDHAKAAAVLTTRLARTYPAGFEVRSQSTLPLGEHVLLEPDVFVARGHDDWGRFPSADQVVLVVEVARTSVRRDRTQKAALYAAWGAAVYWIVDLGRREVVVHIEPGPRGYGHVGAVRDGALELLEITGTLGVEELLPPT